MSAFIPNAGMLFYVRFIPRNRVFEGKYGTPVMEKVQDRSYIDDVFRCVGRDDTMVVADMLTNTYGSPRRLFRITDVQFSPVGPQVAAVFESSTGGQQ